MNAQGGRPSSAQPTPRARMLAAYRGEKLDRVAVAPEFWYYLPAHPEARLTEDARRVLQEGAGKDRAASESASTSSDPVAAAASPAAAAAAAGAVADLRESLGKALRQALAEGGPEAAIEVCRVEAPRLAAAASIEGVVVGRTSHRLRNPENAPRDWVIPLLEEYRQSEPTPTGSRTVDLGAARLGYVEPIFMQPLCTTCHGENVDPSLLERIRERYPADEAIGFRPGELRGLFWAVVDRERAS